MEVFWIVVVVLLFIGLPIWAIVGVRKFYGTRDRGKWATGIGNALVDLDRLITRPSIEYVIQTEDEDKLHEDEKGGD